MYYTPNWFIPSVILLSTLVLLMVISTDLNVPYLDLYRKYINHINFLYFLHLPSRSHCVLSYHDLSYVLVLRCLGVCSLFSSFFALVFYQ
jgi:hypothetical protein